MVDIISEWKGFWTGAKRQVHETAGRLGLRSRRRASSAELIAPFCEFAEALQAASPEERRILRAGWRSPSTIDQISAAVSARLILARGMKKPELIRYLQHLQNRYLAAVGPSTFARYQSGIPKDVFDNDEKLRAELETISHRLRLAYSISHVRDRYVASIRWMCTIALGVGMVAVGGILLVEQFGLKENLFLLNYAVVGLAGFGGALTSIARRSNALASQGPLAEDPVIQASTLQQGRASLLLAGLTGPAFALVMLLVLMSGVIKIEHVTPAFKAIECAARYCGRPDFEIFGYGYNVDDLDQAKLLLFAFVSGFAEQLVPDVLDRFTRRVGQESGSNGEKNGS